MTTNASSPNLSLPSTIPNIHDLWDISGDKIAIYTLFPISSADLNTLRNLCQKEYYSTNDDYLLDDDDEDAVGHEDGTIQICKIPPNAVMAGCSLKDVVEAHIELCRREPGNWYTGNVIVAVHEQNWRQEGEKVVLVSLNENYEYEKAKLEKRGSDDESEEEGEKVMDKEDWVWRPDYLWCKIEESGLFATSLVITNTDWVEMKENWV